jgi:hypothetical protein
VPYVDVSGLRTWHEVSAAVARALPQGRLAVLPGSHLLPVEAPRLVNAVILAFLSGSIGADRSAGYSSGAIDPGRGAAAPAPRPGSPW